MSIITNTQFSDPRAVASEGERIYLEKYKSEYEAQHRGKFVAIDVNSEQAFLGDTPEQSLEEAKKQAPDGLFHLMKVGSLGAFRVSYTSDGLSSWLYQ
ncbi:MAG: hypothetical protein JO091_01140 [Acidobacteriaceae bacterium]|nr:hypothetical protein [Acidobacteriaceae bacterium]